MWPPDAKVWHTLCECPGKEGELATLRTAVLGPGGFASLTDLPMVWSLDYPCAELARNTLAASSDAFTHLGEKWDAPEVFMDGACAHNKDPQLASASWGVTDGRRQTSGPVLGQQTAMRADIHGAIAAAWHTQEGGTIWTDNQTVEQTVGRGIRHPGWKMSPHAVLWNILWGDNKTWSGDKVGTRTRNTGPSEGLGMDSDSMGQSSHSRSTDKNY